MSGEGAAAGGNSALRALLEEAEMSNAGLARAVVSAAAREGKHAGTSATSVRRMLDGSPAALAGAAPDRRGAGPAAAPGSDRHRLRVPRPRAHRGGSV
ncbi:MAG: hypothetical protein ACRDRW_02690 [Pseudonocardiaceae bacterium]